MTNLTERMGIGDFQKYGVGGGGGWGSPIDTEMGG